MLAMTIAGNIGKDAETRQAGGSTVTGFSVAVEDRSGREKRTLWFDVGMWGKRGDAMAQYLTKGSKITASGTFTTREHDGKTYLKLTATEITLQGGNQQQSGGNKQSQQDGNAPDLDDEIPF